MGVARHLSGERARSIVSSRDSLFMRQEVYAHFGKEVVRPLGFMRDVACKSTLYEGK